MDEQVEFLRGIYAEMKAINGTLRNDLVGETSALRGELGAAIAALRTELGSETSAIRNELATLRVELITEGDIVHRRRVERDVRLATTMSELSRDIRELTVVVHEWRDEHRLDRADLRDRVERIERRLGFPR